MAQEGRIQALVTLAQDITDRKQAELDLHQSEQRFQAIFSTSPVGIAQLDLQGRLTGSRRNGEIPPGSLADELLGLVSSMPLTREHPPGNLNT